VNPEWAKYITTALVSTGTYVGGVLTGLFIKSLEEWWKTRVERRRLRKALYHELGQNMGYMFEVLYGHLAEPELLSLAWTRPLKLEECERREVYDHALVSQPILFRGIKEANLISDFYLTLDRLKTESPDRQVQGIRSVYKYVSDLVSKGQMSRRLLRKGLKDPSVLGLSHPLITRVRHVYRGLQCRNLPKDGKSWTWTAPRTLFQKIRVLWRGVPDDVKLVTGPVPSASESSDIEGRIVE
jgi:hypothetical protein